MKTRRTAVAVLIAMLASSLPSGAIAQDDPVTTQARARFKEGVDFYDKGQFEMARLSFLQAYALKQHPAVLLNLAQSSLKAGHPLEASKFFQQFLRESTTASPQQRQDAENGIEEAREKLGRLDISAPAGTEITLDEKEALGTSPLSAPVEVEPGPHSLRAGTETVRVTAVAGQRTPVRFGTSSSTGVAPAVDDPTAANASTSDAIGADGSAKRSSLLSRPENMTPVYIGLAVAGVGLVSTVVFALFRADAQNKADDVAARIRTAAAEDGLSAQGICSSTDTTVTQRFGNACQTLKDNNGKVDTNATIANVSAVVMGAGLVTAGLWYLLAPKRDDRPSSNGTLSAPVVTPYVGYQSGGLGLSGSF